MSQTEVAELITSVVQAVDTVIEQVSAILPKDFPTQVSQSIFDGMRTLSKKLTMQD